MRKEIRLSCIIIIATLFFSCVRSRGEVVIFNDAFFKQWRRDKKGCGSFRANNFQLLIENKTKIVGVDIRNIRSKLGAPEKKMNNGNWLYYLEGGIQCLGDSNIVDVKVLIVEIENQKNIIDLKVLVP
ncbi:hypothetical protein SapgrDRAFT_3205 [Saprospira grandis DSM 2844]|uniref:Lipoprotein n=1 Tax=Saprospira grandis DSM 2844 TaxID=694433 RepID=J1I7Q8_9BACT|nr:hypothetical protein [Saprospira grandis]EJF54850.1 hypothetical protein SapgrDRAFT_3205 [Saprospira grandis DSM 2844]